jgi:1,4-alpha-glucan branching enzyme
MRPINDMLALCRNEPSLKPYEHLLLGRYERFEHRYDEIERNEGSIQAFADSYETYGVHRLANGDVSYVEFAPGATRLALMGDFNDWTPFEHCGEKDEFGRWSLIVPKEKAPKHGDQIRVVMETGDGRVFDRIPAWIRAIAPCTNDGCNLDYHNGVFHDPPESERHAWRHEKPERKPAAGLRIYEAHVGMSSEEGRCGTYREFADDVLPKIAELGYNTVQLMAVADHAYYACFGYQITNFFAVAHRSGSPEDLKYLVDTAHGLGLQVLMDLVHAHASDNTIDGLNEFDGTQGHLFHEDPNLSWHALWGTRMFDYGRYETLRFLLSNVRFWSEEYKFDGFRFDGVTAMLYKHRGVHWDFLGGHDEMYGHHADEDACVYLMLANELLRGTPHGPAVTTVAEDVSGQTGVCRPVWHGGLGFDLRLSMGPPDHWSKLAHEPDFNWTPSRVAGLILGRNSEPAVAYLESHDQCLVGDKTFAFTLMDAAMYEGMNKHADPIHPAIERGVALHKIARLLTLAAGGEAWLNFMGNEFGHPEWVDFPREGNANSFHHARRQWSLRDDDNLYYKDLNAFDGALMKCDEENGLMIANRNGAMPHVFHCKDDSGVLAFHCGSNLVVANVHPHESYPYYKVGSAHAGRYRLVLDTDAKKYGGWGRIDENAEPCTEGGMCDWQGTGVCLYVPSRSAQVYALVDEWEMPVDEWGVHHDADFGYDVDDWEHDTGGGGDDAVWF